MAFGPKRILRLGNGDDLKWEKDAGFIGDSVHTMASLTNSQPS